MMKWIPKREDGKLQYGFSLFNYVLAVVLFIIMMCVCMGKEGMHVDEYYTFSLSNSLYTEASKVRPVIINNQEFTGEEIFDTLLGTTDETKFNIVNVIKKQSADVHPPLYYMIVNFWCSFVDNGDLLIPIGLAINIVLYLLVYFSLIKLIQIWVEKLNYAGIIAFMCCTTYGMLNGVVFIRMYVLLLLITVLLAYWLISHYLEEEKNIRFYIGLYILTVCGTLTQYYFVLYLISISLTYGVLLAFHKRYKELGLGIITVVGGVGTAFVLFPAMYYHVFQSYRGVESIEASTSGVSWDRIVEYIQLLNKSMFGGSAMFVIAFLLGVLCATPLGNKVKRNKEVQKYMLLIIPAIVSFLVIANSAPYVEERYIYALFFCFYLFIMLIAWKVLQNKKNVLTCFVILILGINIYSNINLYPYINQYKEQALESDTINKVVDEETVCICIYNPGARWKIFTNLLCFRDYDNIVFMPYDEVENTDLDGYDNIVLFMESALLEEFDMSVFSNQYNNYEEVTQKMYWSVYNMYNQ